MNLLRCRQDLCDFLHNHHDLFSSPKREPKHCLKALSFDLIQSLLGQTHQGKGLHNLHYCSQVSLKDSEPNHPCYFGQTRFLVAHEVLRHVQHQTTQKSDRQAHLSTPHQRKD